MYQGQTYVDGNPAPLQPSHVSVTDYLGRSLFLLNLDKSSAIAGDPTTPPPPHTTQLVAPDPPLTTLKVPGHFVPQIHASYVMSDLHVLPSPILKRYIDFLFSFTSTQKRISLDEASSS